MSKRTNWSKIKKKITEIISLEKDDENLELKIVIHDEEKIDEEIEEFINKVEILVEEIMNKLKDNERFDDPEATFQEEENYALLTFGNKNAFELTSKLYKDLFFGDLLRNLSQGKKRVLEDYIEDLT